MSDARELALENKISALSVNFTAVLTESNDLLRSAYAIASRHGADTNWDAWIKRLESVLIKQSLALNGTAHLPAATCTPKTFRMPAQ